jgi:hypothetical protein
MLLKAERTFFMSAITVNGVDCNIDTLSFDETLQLIVSGNHVSNLPELTARLAMLKKESDKKSHSSEILGYPKMTEVPAHEDPKRSWAGKLLKFPMNVGAMLKFVAKYPKLAFKAEFVMLVRENDIHDIDTANPDGFNGIFDTKYEKDAKAAELYKVDKATDVTKSDMLVKRIRG